MTRRFLLDTNVLSEPVHRRPNAFIVQQIRRHQDEIVTAAPVLHELLYGVRRLPPSWRRRELEEYIHGVVQATIPILSYDASAADWHAAERARLVAIGRTPPLMDRQIAAIAATNGLVLVTANLSDHQAFSGLQLADWRT